MPATKPFLVFFGVEVSDHTIDGDVLQIAMKRGSAIFNEYIDPTKPIDIKLNAVNHLTVRDWHLYRDGVMMPSRPLRLVLERLLTFLKQFNNPCMLICHEKCYEYAGRLIRVISRESMETEFGNVIVGFQDTFCMFKKKFPTRENTFLTLHRLAAEAQLKWSHDRLDGRCVKHNAALLEKLALHHFTEKDFKIGKKFRAVLQEQVKLLQKAEKKAKKRLEKKVKDEQSTEQVETEEANQEESEPEVEIEVSKNAKKRNEKKERKLARLKSCATCNKTEVQVYPADHESHATKDEPNEENEFDVLRELYDRL